jgi:hypothetical protein
MQHDSEHRPIPAEAKGRVRLFKTKAAQNWARVEQTVGNAEFGEAAASIIVKSSPKGRERAFKKLARLDRFATLEVKRTGRFPLVVWSVFKPRGAVYIDPDNNPGLAQDCVTIDYVFAGLSPSNSQDRNERSLGGGLWTLEIPDHALGRLAERDPGVDIGAVLRAAHYAALHTPVTAIKAGLDDAAFRFALPAGRGVFLCDAFAAPEIVSNRRILHLHAYTWFHDDSEGGVKTRQRFAVGGPHPGTKPGLRLGDSLLLPSIFQHYKEVDGKLVIPWRMPELFKGKA